MTRAASSSLSHASSFSRQRTHRFHLLPSQTLSDALPPLAFSREKKTRFHFDLPPEILLLLRVPQALLCQAAPSLSLTGAGETQLRLSALPAQLHRDPLLWHFLRSPGAAEEGHASERRRELLTSIQPSFDALPRSPAPVSGMPWTGRKSLEVALPKQGRCHR